MFRDLEQIAASVYIFPKDETPNAIQPNIGVIQLKSQTILVDSGNSPRHARQILAALNNHLLPPLTTIIFTHHHWDHTFGASSMKVEHIITHEKCAEYLAQYAEREWNVTALREEISENPKREISNNAMIDAISDWREFRIPRPTMTLSDTLTLYLDDAVIELEYVGGIHADDSIIVKLPQQKVMFLGDSYYPKPFHLREEGDEDLDLGMLQTFLDAKYEVYVDGHGAPRSHAEFEKMIAWERGRQGVSN